MESHCRGFLSPVCSFSRLSSTMSIVSDDAPEQVPREVVAAQPVHVARHRLERVAHAGQHEHVEALVRLDQRIGQAIRVRRVHVVVDVAGDQHQVALQVLRQLRVLLDVVLEGDLAVLLDFLDAVVLLAPAVVVDVVLVVARLGPCHLEEVRIDEHRRRGHEAAAGVAPDADAIDVDERMPLGELLDRRLLVGQPVVAQVAVAVVVVPLRPLRMAAAVADLDRR